MNEKDKNILKEIKSAAKKLNKVDIIYVKKGGALVERTVDPYELRGPDFWAACNQHGKRIHRFKKARILEAEEVNEKFKPKWPVLADPSVKRFIEGVREAVEQSSGKLKK
jgi:predicted DNA-binding transcriptional regulator YafY